MQWPPSAQVWGNLQGLSSVAQMTDHADNFSGTKRFGDLGNLHAIKPPSGQSHVPNFSGQVAKNRNLARFGLTLWW
jgi:hypothetical protein